MAHGTYTSGKEGKVYIAGGSDVELEITEWERTGESQTDRFATSKTDGELISEPGNKGSTGSVQGKLVTESGVDVRLLLVEGQKVNLKLGYTSTRGINQPACIKNLKYGVNVNSGEMQTFSFDWESTGAGVPY